MITCKIKNFVGILFWKIHTSVGTIFNKKLRFLNIVKLCISQLFVHCEITLLQFQQLRFDFGRNLLRRFLYFLQCTFKLFKLFSVTPRSYVRERIFRGINAEPFRYHKGNGFSLNLFFVSGRFVCYNILCRVVQKIVCSFVKGSFQGLCVAHTAFDYNFIVSGAVISLCTALDVLNLNINTRNLFESRKDSFFSCTVYISRQFSNRVGKLLADCLRNIENIDFLKRKSCHRLFNRFHFLCSVRVI